MSLILRRQQFSQFLSGQQVESDRQGQWLRRRRLDGALNRVPRDFYPRVWSVLEKCDGICIGDKILPQNLTQEMTSGELKFALAVETVLNSIPQPEYRQLIVEALMVLTLLVECRACFDIGSVVVLDQIVHNANQIFVKDQMQCDGDATLCCAKGENNSAAAGELCGGAAGVCVHLYDSAPSGKYGTISYMTRAVADLLSHRIPDNVDCAVS